MTFTTPPRLLRKSDWPDPATLPTMYDLPSENPEEPGLLDEFHDYQPDLLNATFRLQDFTDDNSFSAADLNLYYDPEHNWYKRPDWFAVLGKPAGCDPDELRLSYVVWQERLSPFVVVELISPGTENEDFGRTSDREGKPPTKWTVYEQILQIPYYVIYDRYEDVLNGFKLTDGQYQPIEIGSDRKIWLPEAKAGLGLWQGKYNRFTRTWLRWYDEKGWILTETEQAQLRAKRAQKELEQLKAKLKALGIDINDLGIADSNTHEQPENGK